MLQLYFDPGCPFCARVLRFLEEHDIEFESKEISLWVASDTRRELVELSGRSQVPYLVDPERGVAMHESEDIVDYLREHYVDDGAS